MFRSTRILLLALVVLAFGGWTTDKASGNRAVLLHIDAAATYAFNDFTGTNITDPTSGSNPDSVFTPFFTSIARVDGSNLATLVVYSGKFPAGSDTVFVGDAAVQMADIPIDSIKVVTLGAGNKLQALGTN